jgi:hypothetical protein
MSVTGFDDIRRNLHALEARMRQGVLEAADEIAHLLENYAKTHHGTSQRVAGWVYPGGGRWETVSNLYTKGTGTIGKGKVWRATRRWREAGIGWGDVTGNLNQSIKGEIAEVSKHLVRVSLSAGMDYAFWVETIKKGRWAFLWPAVEANKDNIMKVLQRHLTL